MVPRRRRPCRVPPCSAECRATARHWPPHGGLGLALREGLARLEERLQVAEDPRPAAATHGPELVVARRHGVQARHAGQLMGDREPADAVLPRTLDLPG